ncbi:MAG: hypothetical protein IPH88_14715 [Bacteroidales bacterium]|nr:hypothetical protein [Bacteroidales bacterium]
MKLPIQKNIYTHIFIAILILGSLIFQASPCLAQNAASDNYSSLVKSAEESFTAKNYSQSLDFYNKALVLKPGDKAVTAKIDELRKLIANTDAQKNKSFEDLVLEGEKFYKSKDYPTSKRYFQQALDLDPSSQYAKDRLAAIRQVYTDPSDLARYNEAIQKGNKELESGNYDQANSWFVIAQGMQPEQKVPRDKIAECNRLKAESITKKAQYDAFVAEADKLLAAEKREEARAIYVKAAALQPKEMGANLKIKEIDDWFAAKKAKQDSYDKAIEQADQFYVSRDFANAVLKYKEALKVKPEARYPKEMIEKSSNGETQLKSIQEKYDAAIASADNFLKSGDQDAALMGYRSALEFKPSEPYPAAKIKEIETAASERNSRVEAYDIAIHNGDQALSEQKLDVALNHYKNALTLFPDKSYPKDKIAEINSMSSDRKAKQAAYQKAIADGDARLKEKKYPEALTAYNKALEAKSEDNYAQGKIAEINTIVESQKSKNASYSDAIGRADLAYTGKKYDEALDAYKEASLVKPAESYPKERINLINGILSKEKTASDKYNNFIATADNAYSSQKFQEALTAYQNALSIKPAEQYPSDRITAINLILKDNKARQEMYQQAIITADKLFGEKQYERATAAYNEAKSIKPEEKYPQSKLDEINSLTELNRKKDSDYQQFIAKGDSASGIGEYATALTAFQSAQKLKPTENYPKERITAISKLIADQKQADLDYKAAIALADKAMLAKSYSDALAKYQQASSIKPAETYPKTKSDEISQILSELKNKDESYASAIERGDKAFAENRLADAVSAFSEATAIKPSEKYPKDKIIAINKQLAEEKALQDNYNNTVAMADAFLSGGKLPEALAAYQKASGLKPAEQYPKDKIEETNRLILEAKNRDEAYQKAITSADKSFTEKDYENARTSYNQALALKANEAYPSAQIQKINVIQDGIKATDANYAKAIAEADASLEQKQYDKSLASYQDASQLKPTESYPIEKIKHINGILENIKATNAAYDKEIAVADQLFSEKKYTEAISVYEKSLLIKPGEKYPPSRITECNTELAKIKDTQEKYDKAIADGNTQFTQKNYSSALESYRLATTLKPEEALPQQKTREIIQIMDEIRVRDENYTKAITDGDSFYNARKFREALEPYERASTIKPEETYPKTQKEKINKELADQKKVDDLYNQMIADADKYLAEKKYPLALKAYEEASESKKEESYPKEKIKAIQTILAEIQAKDEAYNNALAEGDAHLASKDPSGALVAFQSALKIKPGEAYPTEKISKIQAELKAIDDKYMKTVSDADARLSAKEYSEALNFYQQALDIKPGEKYPQDKIAEINETLVREKEEQEKLYAASVADGDRLLAALNYVDAKRAFVKASGIKPSEKYPKDKLIEINLVLDERNRALKGEYDKAIVDADKLYQQKILDQAIDAYEKAGNIKPDETYPGEMIRKIRQYIADHSILDVNTALVLIPAGDEHKFTFKGIEPRLRNNNYVMIRAKAIGTVIPKVYFNYGHDNAKNGGVVLRTITSKEGVDYLIRLAGQDKWYREDNNWFSIYTEGCDIEVSKIQISQGE